MCGIVGAVAKRDIVQVLIEGLERLEYRGYDSAGITVIDASQTLHRVRTAGRVEKLVSAISKNRPLGETGIAHTRWATHGAPSEMNAHPHISTNDIALVHNGIIENYLPLREQLKAAGYHFTSETDTEAVTHLLHFYYQETHNLYQAMQKTLDEVVGAFAIAAIHVDEPHRLIAARRGSPLVLGIGQGEFFVASDPSALIPVTRRVCYLEEGDVVDVTLEGYTIYDDSGHVIDRPLHDYDVKDEAVDPGIYRHHMRKEIFDQPEALNSILEGRVANNQVLPAIFGFQAEAIFDKVQHIQLIACGTSYYSGLAAKHWLESIAKVHCDVEIASEFRYRPHVVLPNTLFVTISQSGETADTLAALHYAKELGYLSTLAICNVPQSSLMRESELVFLTRAGIEIGVASTKAFTAQLAGLMLLTLALATELPVAEKQVVVQSLKSLPRLVEKALLLDEPLRELASYFVDKQHALFLGRGVYFPIALEGALKMKELSYIHAEAYPAGELKHGPLALVDDTMPVIAIAPNNELFGKLRSNLQEVRARGGELIVFTDADFKEEPGVRVFSLPTVPALLAPIVYVIPMQLLAYHVAVMRGTDVDKPRNLAKSVTVE